MEDKLGKKIFKVVQWSSGNVGKASIRGIVQREDLELVGLIVHDSEKVGKDAGVIAGIEETGILATDQIDDILSKDIDCVHYTPLASFRMGLDPEADKKNILSILRRGINVVTTVGYLFPKAFGDELTKEIEEACITGGVSLHGTGYNPGWLAELIPLTMSGMSEKINKITVSESSEFSYYPSKEIVMDGMLMGKTMEEYEKEADRYESWLSGLFKEAVYLIAEGIGTEISNVEEDLQIVIADKDLEIAAGIIKEGTICAQRRKWTGHCTNEVLIIQEAIYRAHSDFAKEWDEPVGVNIEVEGSPNMKISFSHDWNDDPLISTAMHGVNAIPKVCNAEPGFKSFLDLPLITSRI